jgi:hypothetical protein
METKYTPGNNPDDISYLVFNKAWYASKKTLIKNGT